MDSMRERCSIKESDDNSSKDLLFGNSWSAAIRCASGGWVPKGPRDQLNLHKENQIEFPAAGGPLHLSFNRSKSARGSAGFQSISAFPTRNI